MRWAAGESRELSRRNDVVEEEDRQGGMGERSKRGEKKELEESGTNESVANGPQSEAEESTRGWKRGGGIWKGLWGGALQGYETKDAERAKKVAMGRLHQANPEGTHHRCGPWVWGPSGVRQQQEVAVGPRSADRGCPVPCRLTAETEPLGGANGHDAERRHEEARTV